MTLVLLAGASLIWGAVLVSISIGLQRWLNVSGRARQWIWRAGAVLLVLPWLVAPLVSGLGLGLWPAIGDAAVANDSAGHAAFETISVPPASAVSVDVIAGAPMIDWIEVAAVVLLAGWLVRFVAAQFAARSLGRILAHSRIETGGRAHASAAAWARRLGMKRPPVLRIVEHATSPFSCGVLRPAICLPESLIDHLGREALDLVVGHECVHIARGDGWRRPLERVIADILWFNPFAWRMRAELDLARELACDEAIVAASSEPRAYARALRVVAGLAAGLSSSAPAAAMSLSGGGASLIMRMNRTLSGAVMRPRRAGLISVVAIGMIGAPLAIAQVALVTPQAPARLTAPPAPPAAPDLAAVAPSPPVAPLGRLNALAPPAPPAPVLSSGPFVPEAPQAPPAPPAPPAPAKGKVRLSGETQAIVVGPAKVSSKYGERVDPFTKRKVWHDGVDIAQGAGTEIHAPAAGVVSFAGERENYGNVVEMALADGVTFRFAQLQEAKVSTGQKIAPGAVIGLMGMSGARATGPHLHLEVFAEGKSVDPQKVEGLTLIGPA